MKLFCIRESIEYGEEKWHMDGGYLMPSVPVMFRFTYSDGFTETVSCAREVK